MFDKNEIFRKKEILDATIKKNGGFEDSSEIGFYACSCSGGCEGGCEDSCSGRCFGCGKS